ncbi:MAG: hypothetical protein NTY86_10815 [Deltaproteobacteria bacterium]|nr:hypothetical protein [Deltaproteobacteria bacterium]
MNPERFRIGIDGEWSLEDWYVFPRTIDQTYSFLYSITEVGRLEGEPEEDEPLYITYTAHPWRGGYSAVNFYNYLHDLVPKPLRPRVISIHYASPGWLELGLAIGVALSIRRIVKAFCDSGREIVSFYNDIYDGLNERKLQRISVKREELRLTREQIEFAEYSMKKLSKMMAFDGLTELKQITPNELSSLKILLSFFRRIRVLGDYQKNGKADFGAKEP